MVLMTGFACGAVSQDRGEYATVDCPVSPVTGVGSGSCQVEPSWNSWCAISAAAASERADGNAPGTHNFIDMAISAGRVLRDLDALSADTEMTAQERVHAFLTLAEESFDLDAMAEQALPKGLELPKSQWELYTQAYRMHVASAFLDGVRTYGPTVSRVQGVRQTPDGSVLVYLQSARNGSDLRSHWVLCPHSEFRVCDVNVNGMNLSLRQRSDFSAVLERRGFDYLLRALRTGALVRL